MLNINKIKIPKISIITVVKDGMPYLSDCLKSFRLQDYLNKEHIVIYSSSQDDTEEFLLSKKKQIQILKKDNKFNNKWDCLNTGIELATGEIIGVLHADDIFYSKNTLSYIAENFKNNYKFVYGNILFSKKKNILKINRKWISSTINYDLLKYGWMGPHTSFFVKKEILLKNKYINNYNISGDYYFMLNLFYKKYHYKYLNNFITIMRLGGGSTKFQNILEKIKEDVKIAKLFFKHYYICIFFKILRKIPQLINAKSQLNTNEYLNNFVGKK
jgi:glycosyltransferase